MGRKRQRGREGERGRRAGEALEIVVSLINTGAENIVGQPI